VKTIGHRVCWLRFDAFHPLSSRFTTPRPFCADEWDLWIPILAFLQFRFNTARAQYDTPAPAEWNTTLALFRSACVTGGVLNSSTKFSPSRRNLFIGSVLYHYHGSAYAALCNCIVRNPRLSSFYGILGRRNGKYVSGATSFHFIVLFISLLVPSYSLWKLVSNTLINSAMKWNL